MSRRDKLIIPKRFIEKYGENIPLWSFSKINTYSNCSWEYWLGRIKKINSDDNIYNLSGSAAHNIIEGFYKGEIKYENMKDKFLSDFLDIEVSDYRFAKEEDKNDSMRNKYKACVSDFFDSHQPIKTKLIIEQLIWIDVNENLFLGYVDAITKDKEGFYNVIDWKTSTIYKGKKVAEQGKQLLLYALGLHQGGVPIDKIKVCWNFLKYLNVSYMQKNGKLKTSSVERNKWVSAIKTPLKRHIKEHYELEDWEADLKIEECIKDNNLTSLDKIIQEKYTLSDCYVYPEVTEEGLINLKNELAGAISEINERGEEESKWERDEIQPSQEFYCSVLCGLKRHCKYYTAHLEAKGLKEKSESEIIDLLEDILPF